MRNFINKILCYSTGARLEQMDSITKKLMTTYQALNPKSDVARIYLSRKEGGRGLISVEDSKTGCSRA